MDYIPGGNIFKNVWVAVTSFVGNFLGLSGYEEPPDETTGLTKQQRNLIKKSWAIVLENKLQVGVEIFIHLFKTYPSSQDQFEQLKDIKDLEVLAKHKKMKAHALRVIGAFNYLVENIDQIEILEELLRNTAITHYRIRMPSHYFTDLGGVIIEVLGNNLGDKFTPKTKDAWVIFYTYWVKTMLDEIEQLEPSE